MKYTFKNGAQVEGTAEQILAIAKSLGETIDANKLAGGIPRGFYNSSHNGIIPISGMNDRHIKNALIKSVKAYYEDLYSKIGSITNRKFQQIFVEFTDNKVIEDLFNELSKRK